MTDSSSSTSPSVLESGSGSPAADDSSVAGWCIDARLTATLPDVAKNVLGGELEICSVSPLTGWLRDGCCNTAAGDMGVHTVCVVLTAEFLEFSKEVGNDLSTPRPEFRVRRADAGAIGGACAHRGGERPTAPVLPPRVVLEATHALTLEWVSLADLRDHAHR